MPEGAARPAPTVAGALSATAQNTGSVAMTGRHRACGIVALLLVAANLRPALTGVGPLLGTIRDQLGLSSAVAGAVTTLPLFAFAVISPLAPRISRALGLERSLLVALVILAAGTALRWGAGNDSGTSVAVFFAGTALIGTGIAIGNVLLPSLVKRDYPHAVGLLTSAYATVMGTIAALASGVVVPISDRAPGGWRTALGCWLVLVVVAIAFWVPRRAGQPTSTPRATALPWHSRLAWLVTGFMGLQSLGFYVLIAWLPTVLRDAGSSASAAGWELFWMQAVAALVSLGTPLLMRRLPDQRGLAAAASMFSLAGYAGFLFDAGHPTLWAAVAGVGSGSTIVLALAFLSLRAGDAPSAAALSGMAQSIGYLLAAAGPVLIGVVHQAAGGWRVPLLMLCSVAIVQVVVGFTAGRGVVDHMAV